MDANDNNKNSMEELKKIIERYTDGNYLIGNTAREEMANDILFLFDISGCTSSKRISGDGVFFRCSNCEYEPDMNGAKDDLTEMKYCPECGSKFV